MKKWILAAAILGTVSLQTAGATTLSFSSQPDAVIHFDGASNFSFDNLGTYDFTMSGGLVGNIDGTYTIGTVTGGTLESAPVTGIGTFSIYDGTDTLTASVDWISIFTFNTVGGINDGGSVNLSSISYSGSNASLLALANSTGIANVSFQFIPSENLDALKTTNMSTSYSGTIAPVPEPMTFSLMGAGLLGLGLLRKRITK